MANPLLSMGAPLANPAPQSGMNMDAIRQAAQSAKQMMNMLSSVKDPQKALMAVAQQNPQLNAVMQMCHGRNPEEVFREECKKCGADPDQIINMLRG